MFFVTSGIPQGSVLGPLFFVIFIDDLIETISPTVPVKGFADDLKLYVSPATTSNLLKLQYSLDCLLECVNIWQKQLAIDKYNCADLGVSGAVDSRTLSPSVSRCALLKLCNVKDLGIVFDSKLTFTQHIAKVVAKAKQKLCLLFRYIGIKDIDSLIKGYKSYVLPVLEYGSPIWSPIKVSYIEAIESVQRKSTKKKEKKTCGPIVTDKLFWVYKVLSCGD